MKKLLTLIIIVFITSNNSFAQDFWSNTKDGPTSVEAAKKISDRPAFVSCIKVILSCFALVELVHLILNPSSSTFLVKIKLPTKKFFHC